MSLPAGRVLALIPDVMAAVRVESAGAVAGVRVVSVASADWPTELGVGAHAAVVDLTAGPIAFTAIAAAVAAGVPTLAFGPHVDGESLAAAARAGARPVLARGAFLRNPAAAMLALLGQASP